jgi:DnaJ-domain-containing protein 1
VEGFIDRLAEFLRTLLSNEERTTGRRARGAEEPRFRDPDMQSAWEELDDYMRGTKADTGSGRREKDSARPTRPADESLRADYANLEVPFGADMAKVMKSYKRLILKYHPDKHAGDPEKQQIALDITKRINQSYERIRSRYEGPSS